MSANANARQAKELPVCVKWMIIIFSTLVVIGVVGGLLCWLL